MQNQTYLTVAEMQRQLQVSLRTLAYWRAAGKGPAFVRFGRSIRYLPLKEKPA